MDHAAADDMLASLPDQLAAAYPRAAHRGRLDQIGAHIATLRSLVGQLPDEEEREAEYEERLLGAYKSGQFHQPSAAFTHSDDAGARLADALARNGG